MSVLSDAHKSAWVAFFVSHGRLTKVIDQLMEEAGVIDLAIYDVLLSLEMAPGHRRRMCDLADAIVLSRSGLTRMVDRLEKDGYVRREACPGDRRSLNAVLTEKGLRERERAWPYYEKAISDLFASHMSEAEAKSLANVLNRTIPNEPACPGSHG